MYRIKKYFQIVFVALLLCTGASFASTSQNRHVGNSSSLATTTACVGITNVNTTTFILSGYNGDGAYCGVCPSTGQNCYTTLSAGGSQAVIIPSSSWLYLQYDICSSVSYNDAGNAVCGGYLGYVGLTFSNGSVAISSVEGGTAKLGTPSGGYYPLTFTPSTQTFGLQNNTSDTFVFTSVSSDTGSSCNGSCYQTLAPGSQQFVTVNPSGWINLQYTVCGSIAYDDEGTASCAVCTSLGSFGVTCTNTGCSISNVYDGNASLVYDTSSYVYDVNYTTTNPPCPQGSTIPTPQTYSQISGTGGSVAYRGVNLAGCDFETFSPPCPCDAVYFTQQGANTIRLPVYWEYLQGTTPLGTAIDFTQGDALVYSDLVTSLTESGLTVLIDMHNYMRYYAEAPGTIITGSAYTIGANYPDTVNGPTADQYATAWGSIATQFATNPLVMFDLMNEPNDMATELILSNYNTAIEAVRAAESAAIGGVSHLLLLEGNQYTCLGAWEDDYYGTPNSTVFTPGYIVDSANNYAINVHQYFTGNGDVTPTGACGSGSGNCVDASTVLTTENFSAFISYLQANQLRAFLTELNGEANANCAACVYNFLAAVQDNASATGNVNDPGFIGWTGWSGGSFDTSYILNLTPTYVGDVPTASYQFQNGFQPFLTPL